MKSCFPISSSSCRTWWLTALDVTPSASAAAFRLPSRAVASNALTALSVGWRNLSRMAFSCAIAKPFR